jgi:hypothetical protein
MDSISSFMAFNHNVECSPLMACENEFESSLSPTSKLDSWKYTT